MKTSTFAAILFSLALAACGGSLSDPGLDGQGNDTVTDGGTDDHTVVTTNFVFTAPAGVNIVRVEGELLAPGQAFQSGWSANLATPNANTITLNLDTSGKDRARFSVVLSSGEWGCTLKGGAAVEVGTFTPPTGWGKGTWLAPGGAGCSNLATKQ